MTPTAAQQAAPARDDRVQRHQVPQLISSMQELLDVLVAHDLYAFNVSITPARPGAKRFDHEAGEWLESQPEIHVTMHDAPGELLRWLTLFQVDTVQVFKARFSTRFEVRVRRHHYEWSLTSSVRCRDRGPRLPGVQPRWEKHPGMPPMARISRAEFRLVLAGLGVRRREPGFAEPVPIQASAVE